MLRRLSIAEQKRRKTPANVDWEYFFELLLRDVRIAALWGIHKVVTKTEAYTWNKLFHSELESVEGEGNWIG